MRIPLQVLLASQLDTVRLFIHCGRLLVLHKLSEPVRAGGFLSADEPLPLVSELSLFSRLIDRYDSGSIFPGALDFPSNVLLFYFCLRLLRART